MNHIAIAHPSGVMLCAAIVVGAPVSFAKAGPADQWRAPDEAARQTSPLPADKATIAAGQAVFASTCAACHGAAGKGDGPLGKMLTTRPKDLGSAEVLDQTDGSLFWFIAEGRSPMPAYRSLLTEQKRWELVQYIRTLGVTPPRHEASDSLRSAVSAVLKPYGQIRRALAASDAAAAGKAGAALKEAVSGLAKVEPGASEEVARSAWKKDSEALSSAIAKWPESGADAAALRERFGTISTALVAMIADFGDAEDAPVRVFAGPGLKASAPAVWVQTETEPNNPCAPDAGAEAATLQRQLGAKRPEKSAP
jgi:mono/diheme cytochrome c family protein